MKTQNLFEQLEEFALYFELGIKHIAGFHALVHIFWILAIVVVFQMVQLNRMILLVTIFTVGHSLGLLFGTLEWVSMNTQLVGFLVPGLLLILCFTNIWTGTSAKTAPLFFRIFLVSAYGLIHGLGYNSYLNMLTSNEGSDFIPTLAFDMGVEMGQLIVVAVIQIFSILSFHFFHIKHRDWILVISGISAGAAIMLIDKAIFW